MKKIKFVVVNIAYKSGATRSIDTLVHSIEGAMRLVKAGT